MNNEHKVARHHGKLFFLALFLSLATGRWGAWIGLPSVGIFLIDVIFFTGLTMHLVTKTPNFEFILYIFLTSLFIIISLILSGDYSLNTRLRDLLPFVYILFSSAISRIVLCVGFKKFLQVFRFGCLAHLIWSGLSVFGLISPASIFPSFFGQPVFSTRWDLAGMIEAIGILAWNSFPKEKMKSSRILIIFFGIVGLFQGSRAGALAVLFAWFITILRFRNRSGEKSAIFRRLLLVLISFLAGFLAITVITLIAPSSAVSRLGITSDSEISYRAEGTARARNEARRMILEWQNREDLFLFGAGPGREFVLESGAINFLSGSADVRAPHNWAIGLLARYGIFGSIFWFFLVLYPIFRFRPPNIDEGIFVYASMAVIFAVACLGVIIESPFGSLPLSVLVGLAISWKYRGKSNAI